MAYTAFEQMRLDNLERFGEDLGPVQPPFPACGEPNGLKSAALRFIREECEGLRFDRKKELLERKTGVLLGKSLRKGQIPYNMEMDADRLSLERALGVFIDSGVSEDAYMVYYCFLEMFLGCYGRSKKMVELLSEYEENGSSLLLKHRDHYSHSVYVFALGLAIYESNAAFRREFKRFYGFDADEGNRRQRRSAANTFLEFWGLTSLFHDIGYPFELPYEQVLSYFEVDRQERGAGCPYLVYRNIGTLTGLDEAAQTRFRELYGLRFETVGALLAHDLAEKLGGAYGFDEAFMRDVIESKPVSPENYGYFMDHAVFSAARLCRELCRGGARDLTRMHVDVLSAIVLHNSIFKFKVNYYKDKNPKPPLRMDQHPLAWMLMLCDELQCWDRTAYGRNSRTELHPLGVRFDFSNEAIRGSYHYDLAEREKIDAFNVKYRAWEEAGEKGKAPRLKAYSDMAEKEQRFVADIRKIVDTAECPLSVEPDLRPVNRENKHTYLSDSSFMHLYDFAVALHGRSLPPSTPTWEMERRFERMSLAYQLSTLGRARSFSRFLDALGCFFTDRPVDYDMVTQFTPEQVELIAPMEHERWVREHQERGWQQGDDYQHLPVRASLRERKKARAALREQLRMHELAMDGELTPEAVYAHYLALPEREQGKDWKPFNTMLALLKKFDGLRIYKL